MQIRLFYCEACGKGFNSFAACRQHKSRMHGEQGHACPIAERGYSATSNSILQRHMRRHSGEKPFACETTDCGKAFASRGDVLRHTRNVHELSRPFLCQQCPYSGSSKTRLEKHVKAVHEKVKEWRCELCPRQFSAKSNLTSHVVAVHERKCRLRCAWCKKSFYSRHDLDRHALTHVEDAKFKCDECERSFTYKRSLTTHAKHVHGNAPRPKHHKCDLCEYATAIKSQLEDHVRARHKQKRPFHCIECSQSFAWEQGLRNHLQLHGTQTFNCTQCDRQYRRQNSLLSHTALQREKLRCDFCQMTTHWMRSLKSHVLAKHKDELRQTIVDAHSEAPCCTPEGEVTASRGDVWVKYEPAPGLIGQGDFGSVFKAKLRSAQTHAYRYAIKSVDLTTILLEPEAHLRKCRREVQLMHECRHENVVPVYEFFEFYYENEPDSFCMVMELGSESLTSVKDEHDLTEVQCLFVLIRIAAALKHIHSLGIVHRDVKPDNVMICFNGVPKLCDFGESARLRADGTCIGPRGSPMYKAPETGNAANPKSYGTKVDVFSLGISAAEVAKKGEYRLIRTKETNVRKAISARTSHMSPAYQELVLACVVSDPSKRPSSTDVFDSLENGPAKGLDASCLDNILENFIH